MIKLLLPDPEYFMSEELNCPPLLKFYDWVIRNSNPAVDILSTDGEITELLRYTDISKINIHEEYEKELKAVTKRYIIKKYKCNAKQASQELSWHFLDIGPSIGPIEGIKKKSKKHVYLLDGFLRNKINE